jgi:hypothetical protein
MAAEFDTDLRVYLRHIRACGHCLSGARRWFAAHGLDWSDFIRNGIPAYQIVAIGDTIANSVVDRALKENHGK